MFIDQKDIGRLRDRGSFLFRLLRRLVLEDEVHWMEFGSILIAIIWVVCLGMPGNNVFAAPIYGTIRTWSEWPVMATLGTLATVQIVVIAFDHETWRTRIDLVAAAIWGFVGSVIIVNAPTIPTGWVYLAFSFACTIPIIRPLLNDDDTTGG